MTLCKRDHGRHILPANGTALFTTDGSRGTGHTASGSTVKPKYQVSGYLQDHIMSHDIILDAVTTPNGDFFDREIITTGIDLYQSCPVTRHQLYVDDLWQNRVL